MDHRTDDSSRRRHRYVADVETERQRRSRGTLPPHHLGGVHRRAVPYSARREP